ncbi:unnamed protein product [Callosobruchus maculatus]|uniref:Uncharacterized protein n=1 Tax=Callosobruchus maculatus TaxID=64391 RepID=A0A653CUC2_CALMS|nr:unnamed protein product [Callosobruchus maculatus]
MDQNISNQVHIAKGADSTPSSLSRPEDLFVSPGELSSRPLVNCGSPFSNGQSPASCDTSSSLGRSRPRPSREGSTQFVANFATMRRDHIIADAIPGPESCV